METLPSPRQVSHRAEWGPSFPGRLSLADGGFWVVERGCVLTPRAPDAAKLQRIGVSHPHWSVSVSEGDDHAPAAQVTQNVRQARGCKSDCIRTLPR